DLHMSGQCSIIGKDDFVSNGAIVPDVAVSQKISPTADLRFAIAGGAPIYGNEFAERVFIANFQIGRLARVFQVLRLLTDRAVTVKFIFSAGAHRPRQSHVMLQPAALPQHDVRADHAVRADYCSRTDSRTRIDKRRRMNLHVAHRSRNVNINSPSETIASFTTQWHFAFARRSPRDLVSSAWMKMVSPGKTGLRNFTSSAPIK